MFSRVSGTCSCRVDTSSVEVHRLSIVLRECILDTLSKHQAAGSKSRLPPVRAPLLGIFYFGSSNPLKNPSRGAGKSTSRTSAVALDGCLRPNFLEMPGERSENLTTSCEICIFEAKGRPSPGPSFGTCFENEAGFGRFLYKILSWSVDLHCTAMRTLEKRASLGHGLESQGQASLSWLQRRTMLEPKHSYSTGL